MKVWIVTITLENNRCLSAKVFKTKKKAAANLIEEYDKKLEQLKDKVRTRTRDLYGEDAVIICHNNDTIYFDLHSSEVY